MMSGSWRRLSLDVVVETVGPRLGILFGHNSEFRVDVHDVVFFSDGDVWDAVVPFSPHAASEARAAARRCP